MILLNERHLRRVLREWVAHYNRGRPHASLGPGIPDGPDIEPVLSGHRIREATASSPLRFSAVFIMSTVWSHQLREAARTSVETICGLQVQ
jgi:hypothetical protein